MLSEARQGSLQAILFHLVFWHMDLGYFGRGLLGSWPQADIGIVLWSLSVSAGDWQTSEKLTRLCTIPEPAILSGTWDRSAYAMEAQNPAAAAVVRICWSTAAKRSPTAGSGRGIIIARRRCSIACWRSIVKMDFAEGPRH